MADHARSRLDDLDPRRVRHLAVHSRKGRVSLASDSPLDQRKKAIEESIDAAERTRVEADELLVEYRERLREARPARR